ncbi:hypothetical protein GGI12_003594 [Dipsacomyces acuminosporus]|nr:hypothetical protein GGI12_003594 [Dipsacomyces acuminosporus]
MLALQSPSQSLPGFVAQAAPSATSGLPRHSLLFDGFQQQKQQQQNALAIYLANSIKRDIHILASIGAIRESGVKVILSYLHASTSTSAAAIAAADEEEAAILNALGKSSTPSRTASGTPDSTLSVGSASRPPPPLNKDAAADTASKMSGNPSSASANADSSGSTKRPESKCASAMPKTMARHRSETAPLRPLSTELQQQQQTRVPGSPRKDKTQKHEGLSAKIGALFGKFSQDSDTSPKARSIRSNTSAPSPVFSSGLRYGAQQVGISNKGRAHSKPTTGSDYKLQSATLASLAAEEQLRLHEQNTSSISKTSRSPTPQPATQLDGSRSGGGKPKDLPLGIAAKRAINDEGNDAMMLRKASQGSQRSLASSDGSVSSATIAECSESVNGSDTSSVSSQRNVSSSTSSIKSTDSWKNIQRTSVASSTASTLASRKRSYTHLGLSMDKPLPPIASPPTSPSARTPQLRRTKPSPNLAGFQVKYSGTGMMTEGKSHLTTQAANSLGIVLQTPGLAHHSKPLPTPNRAQRHHNSFSFVSREPRSPVGRAHHGLASIVHSRYVVQTAKPTAAAAAGSVAFPPMPNEASQQALMSASLESMGPAPVDSDYSVHVGAQSAPSLPVAPGTNSTAGMASSAAPCAQQPLIATAIYNYSSSIKGDLQFTKGDRIIVQSKVNNDWWLGSVISKHDEYGTAPKRTGMFPRSHVTLAYRY